MRLLLAVLAIFGLYQLLLRPRSRRAPRALLADLHARDGTTGDEEEAPEQGPRVIYEVVAHDDGWAYRVGDVFSESFATRQQATAAAEQAAAAHRSAGAEVLIEYQDRRGRWHEELEPGDDRPETRVETRPATGG